MTHVMKLMTMPQPPHVPVKDGDQLVGIISIGDVLKHRLGELEVEVTYFGHQAQQASDLIKRDRCRAGISKPTPSLPYDPQ